MRPSRHLGRIALVLTLVFAGAPPALGQQKKGPPAAKNATATGTWEWPLKGPAGVEYTIVLKLKQDGEKLTGTLRGVFGPETKIQEGKVSKDGEISFEVIRDRGDGQKFTQKYRGQLKGDSIKGTIEAISESRSQTRDWEAHRVKDDKKDGAKPKAP
jgi:hypothetical protein